MDDNMRLCERGLIEGCLRMAELLGGSHEKRSEYSKVVVPGGFFYSRAYGFRPKHGEKSVRALKRDILSGDAPNNLMVYASDLTLELETQLMDEGFFIFAEQTGMMFDLGGDIAAPKSHIIRVDKLRIAEWAKCVNSAIGKDDAVDIFEAMQSQPEASFYGVEDEGRIVSTVLLATFGGVACLHEGGTYPEYRGRGYISDLLRRAMLDAKAQGFGKIVLQASPMGAPVYEKLGFESIGTLKHWQLKIDE